MSAECRARVRASMIDVSADGEQPRFIQHKWKAECSCGWLGLSWQWVAEDRPGGALVMAVEHVGGSYPQQLTAQIPARQIFSHKRQGALST